MACTPALFVTYSAAAAAVCVLWRYISVMPLPLDLLIVGQDPMFPTFKTAYVFT